MDRILACIVLAGASLLVATPACAGINVTVEAAGVRTTTTPLSIAATETFNSQTVSNTPQNLGSVFGSTVGAAPLFNAAGSTIDNVIVAAANNNGGASAAGTGFISNYGNYGRNYNTSSVGTGDITIALNGGVTYFGLDMESVNTGNTVSLYSGATLLYTFSTSDLMPLIGASYLSANGDYWAFVNFYATGGATIDKVVLSGNYFESDNYTIGNYTATTGTAVVSSAPTSPPVGVPTLPDWGEAILALLLGLTAATTLRMRTRGRVD